jgi:hypothetical protein
MNSENRLVLIVFYIEVVIMYRVEEGKVGKLALFFSYHSHSKL